MLMDSDTRARVFDLTICSECQWSRRTQDPGVGHRVLHQADVAPHVRGLYLGDVQVPRLLRDEASAVLSHKRWKLVEHPAVDDL
ncbi:hypothetical protein AMELA_G00042450 [Ameiurus melas]|uniref:Uncharacterized protein n=1 Tax=Ameiurus melas TaxID=219545 RepID=A0A7J6BDS4_AMEME|nr:hypothetical protein AMELA_G00042450 [Ameiurus melas]